MNLMWFRSDLRIYDNPALHHAVLNGPTITVYFITPEQWRQHNMAPIKQHLILRELIDLKSRLAELNIPLLVFDTHDFSGSLSKLITLTEQYNIDGVFFNLEYEWNEQGLTDLVCAKLSSLGKQVNTFHDQCLIKPGEIRNKEGGFYKVFTAFKKAYFNGLFEHCRPLFKKPSKQKALNIQSNITCVLDKLKSFHEMDAHWQTLWPSGEEYAHNLLGAFTESQIIDYQQNRDIPSMDATSKMSAYLAIGVMSVRQCYQAAMSVSGALSNQGVNTWVVELVWRDFYRHLMAAFPEICRYKPFKPNTDRLPWKQDMELFKAWCEGRTGYPVVDAAMRQLAQTGWMHNRLRMVTAMFLTKHLFIDWRLGEQFFMSHLVDGDLASNNGGWQWSASTGVDAVPYFRIFNPTRQSQRFDAQGDFIRQYVPELASLDNKSIHEPNKQQIMQCGYVTPIVNHKMATAETKARFKQLSDPEAQHLMEYGLQ